MGSAIDITKPQYGNPTTESVRDNFDIASNEISSLQVDVSNRIIKSGDTMAGDLTLFADPTLSMHAANRSWVINQIHSTVNAPIYIGDYDALADRVLTSGQPAIVVNNPLPAAGSGNTQMYLTVKTGKPAPSIGNQPPGGVPVGSWLISNGTNWNIYQPSAVGIVAQTVPVSPEIVSLPGTNVYAALQSVPTLYLPLVGGTLSGALTLFGNPVNPNHAANKTYVDSITKVSTFNTRSGAVTLQQSDVSSVGVFNDTGRNLIHNSMFNIAQRGAGPFSTASAYTLDRWQMNFIGGTYQITQQPMSDSFRVQIGDEAARNYLSTNFTGGASAGDFTQTVQAIEDVRRFAGKTITVSFLAIASVNGLKCGVGLYQSFGTGGSPSAGVFVPATLVTLTNIWARYSVVLNVPSVAGKILGTALNDFTMLVLWGSSGTANNANAGGIGVQSGGISFGGMQLEISSVMTPFEKIDPQQDLAKCQRFYQIGAFDLNFYQLAGNSFGMGTALRTTMRATPTMTTNNVTYSNSSGLVMTSWDAGSINIGAVATATGAARVYGYYAASSDL